MQPLRIATAGIVVAAMVVPAPSAYAGGKHRERTERVAVSSAEVPANADSGPPSAVSARGRYVLFSSIADNLVAGDTNGHVDVFLRDRVAGTTVRVSVGPHGEEANGSSFGASLSADGRIAAFSTEATNLGTGGRTGVVVRDLCTGRNRLASTSLDGLQGGSPADLAVLSADGRSVAFLSEAGNLVTNDTNGVEDVFVRDLRRGVTERVSVATGGAEGNQVGSPFEAPAISGDGRLVAFTSGATNLVAGDDNIFFDDIFVHDRRTGRTEAVSVTADGRTGDRGGSHPAISADGRYVAFDSASSNLVPGDTNGVSDVFVRDLWAGTTRRVSVTRDGRQADADSFRPSLSARGGRVTFTSSAGLVAADTNGALDVYVRNLSSTRTTRQVSVAWDGGQPDSDSFGPPVISLDGRHVAFSSQARNLVPDDIDVPKLFIRDSGMGATPESWSAPG